MFLFILESFSTSELFFVLLMALVFFGPRKLPQLSRTIGKNIAEFRKASEDFKRTWEREVAFEETQYDAGRLTGDSSIMNSEYSDQAPTPILEAVPAADSVGRQATPGTADASAIPAEIDENRDDPTTSEPPRKQDWL